MKKVKNFIAYLNKLNNVASNDIRKRKYDKWVTKVNSVKT